MIALYNRVFIIEDELITATQLKELLIAEEYDVLGIAKNVAEAEQFINQNELSPDVILSDINLRGGREGIGVAQKMKEKFGSEIVYLTAYADAKTLVAAFDTEPVMYVVKPYTDMQLLVAIQMAFYKLFKRKELRKINLQLSTREEEILDLISKGYTSRQIARMMNISIDTVMTHRKNVLRKNDVHSMPQLLYLLTKA